MACSPAKVRVENARSGKFSIGAEGRVFQPTPCETDASLSPLMSYVAVRTTVGASRPMLAPLGNV